MTAMATADWYFDFISPFAYLQSEQLALLGPKVRIRYRPVLLAGLLDAHGQKSRPDAAFGGIPPGGARLGTARRRAGSGPPEIARKRVFTYRFAVWQAKRLGIAFKMPPEHPFNPLPLLLLAVACDCSPEAVHRIFRFVWRDGRLPDLPIEWAELVHDLRLPDAQRRVADPDVKDALRRNTDEAIARGVFGVPTLMIGEEMFWGADATQMAADYIAAGQQWSDPEYARVSALPIGAARREGGAKPKSTKKRER